MSALDTVLVGLVVLPSVAGAVLLGTGRPADRWAFPLGIGVAVVTLGLAMAAAVGRPELSGGFLAGIPAGLRVDGLSAVLVLTVTAVLPAVLVFAAGDLPRDGTRARFVGLMLLFAAAMLVTVTATTLLTLLMAWEVMGATSYALIGFRWHETRRATSGAVAFLTTRAGDLGLYVAAGAALAGGAGGLSLDALADLPSGWVDVTAAGVVLAALGKSAQLPFSFWLSRAMDGPSPVSAMLHSATMVAAGAYLLLRLQPLLATTGWAATLVVWAGAATALLLGAVAVVQRELKQLLAASTCAQIGFMVVAAGAGGVTAGAAHLVAHAATKSLLFLAAGAWLTVVGTERLAALRGVGGRWPVVGTTFVVGAAALAGLAPLSLWASKDRILAAALHTSTPLYLTGLAATAVSAAYASRAAVFVLGRPTPGTGTTGGSTGDGSPRDTGSAHTGSPAGTEAGRPPASIGGMRPALQAPLVPLAAAAAGLGAFAVPGVWSAFTGFTATGGMGITPRWWEYLASALLALGAVGAVAVVVRRIGDVPGQARLADWLGLERVAVNGFATPVLRGAHAAAAFDDRVVAGAVRAVAGLARALSRLATTRGERGVEAGVRAVTAGARTLGGLARRPQTGQLHQYYAQAVVLLAALALLLAVLSAVPE